MLPRRRVWWTQPGRCLNLSDMPAPPALSTDKCPPGKQTAAAADDQSDVQRQTTDKESSFSPSLGDVAMV